MKLVNPIHANAKFVIGTEHMVADADGVLDVKDEDVAKMFLKGGWKKAEGEDAKPSKAAKKSEAKVEVKAEEPKAEEVKAEEPKVEEAEEKPAAKPKDDPAKIPDKAPVAPAE